MEQVAGKLGIPTQSSVYGRALDLFHKVNLRCPSDKRFSAQVFQSAALKLAAIHFDYRLELGDVARAACTTLPQLNSCLEFVVSVLADEHPITLESIMRSIGYPHVALIGAINRLLGQVRMQGAPEEVAAIIYLTMQAISIRMSLAAICAAAMVNIQRVQVCAAKLQPSLKSALATISEDKALVKSIKDAGKQAPKLKRLPTDKAASSDTPSTTTNKSRRMMVDEEITTEMRLQNALKLYKDKRSATDILFRHCHASDAQHGLGYASLFSINC